MAIVTYTNSNTGTIVDCFPVAGSLANWAVFDQSEVDAVMVDAQKEEAYTT